MGMYTELIFGARLKEDTPKEVIDTLKYMTGHLKEKEKPKKLAFQTDRNVLCGSSFYFGVHHSESNFYYSDMTDAWTLSSRTNIKNQDGDIEKFLDWIKPYIDRGSGCREMYAITIAESEDEPTIYYLEEPYLEEEEAAEQSGDDEDPSSEAAICGSEKDFTIDDRF